VVSDRDATWQIRFNDDRSVLGGDAWLPRYCGMRLLRREAYATFVHSAAAARRYGTAGGVSDVTTSQASVRSKRLNGLSRFHHMRRYFAWLFYHTVSYNGSRVSPKMQGRLLPSGTLSKL